SRSRRIPVVAQRKQSTLVNYSFGTCQQRKLFPHFYPPSLLGNKFVPLRGAPHRGPGCYITEDVSIHFPLGGVLEGKPYGICDLQSPNMDTTLYPGMYQKVSPQEQTHKRNFAPFNSLSPRFKTDSKDAYYPGPGTYNPEVKTSQKIIWPMKFGPPDWAQIPCLQKRTLKAEVIRLDFKRQIPYYITYMKNLK
uniref:Protein pitchfork n=1 Tax=Catagonus wagneri TaxID=51154 RepID=A0A8C3YBL5_9CETA